LSTNGAGGADRAPTGSSWPKWVGITTAAATALSATTAFLVWWHPHGPTVPAGNSGLVISTGSTPPSSADTVAATAPAVPDGFTGRWRGIVIQPVGIVSRWPIDLDIPSNSPTGSFAAPTLGCSGRLQIRAVTADSLSVLEEVDSNPNNVCVRGADIVLTPVGDGELRMGWTDIDNPGNSGSAQLIRN
jgi:hypothetical protein